MLANKNTEIMPLVLSVDWTQPRKQSVSLKIHYYKFLKLKSEKRMKKANNSITIGHLQKAWQTRNGNTTRRIGNRKNI